MRIVGCPVCQKMSRYDGNAHRPFCSLECKQRDLGNWATEKYKVAGEGAGQSGGEGSVEEGNVGGGEGDEES